jgi:hypothetical protein
MALKAGKDYELLIEKIYKELAPDAEIKQDDFIKGEETGIERQIDLSIRSKVAGVDILIIIQAKDYNRKADINVIGSFLSAIRDVRAQKGILICNSGFTKKAIDYAKKERVELYSAHTVLNKRWDLEFQIPVIKTEYKFNFKFGCTLQFSAGSYLATLNLNFTFNQGKDILTVVDVIDIFEKHTLDRSGEMVKRDFENHTLQILVNNDWHPVGKFSYEYNFIKVFRHLNYYRPLDYRILKDYINQNYTATYIDYDGIIPLIEKEGWELIGQNNDIFKRPDASYIDLITFIFLDKMYIRFNHIR